jgi:hemerythrin-like domain-containing protein
MRFASEDLRNEHEGILFGLKILERMTELMRDGEEVDRADLTQMIDFLRLFADKCHHGKEESILFPAMEDVGIPRDYGPIGQMLLEHEEGRRYIAEMDRSISGEAVDTQAFAANATEYVELLRAHIDKENDVLFPMGDRMIPEEKQEELLRQFEDHERNVMGPGIHEKLHGALDALENKYLDRAK